MMCLFFKFGQILKFLHLLIARSPKNPMETLATPDGRRQFQGDTQSASAQRYLRPFGTTMDIATLNLTSSTCEIVPMRVVLWPSCLRKARGDAGVVTGIYRPPGIAGQKRRCRVFWRGWLGGNDDHEEEYLMSWEEDERRVAKIFGVKAGQRLPAVSRQTLRQ